MGDDLLEKKTNRNAEIQAGIGEDLRGFIFQLRLQAQAHVSGLHSSV